MDPIYGNLTDDDLLTLGRAAGYIPESEAPEPEAQESTGVEEPYPSPMQGVLTQPEPLQSPPADTGPLPLRNQSYGLSQGYRGFSQDKFQETEKTLPGLRGQMQRADLDAKKAAEPQLQAAGLAAQGSKLAASDLANAQGDKLLAEGKNAGVLQRLYDDFGVEEMKINADTTAQSNQAKADYLAALADFRASRVDPSQLWHNMTGGERFGTLMAAFVHDFLGARGINTSTMATLNKAIDRNIDAQVMGIKTKGEVAEGFKSLWYMQRNQAASDVEARARVRGFLLEGAKQSVIANMAQYESALASAQGQAAVAKIDEELAKNLIDIYRHVDQNALSRRNQALEEWKARLSASIEQQNVSLRAQELELQKKALDAKSKTTIEPIYDPENGEPRWYFVPGTDETLKRELIQSMQGATELNEAFKELRELTRRAKPVPDIIGGTRFADTDQQKYDALVVRMAHGFAKANGERATDQDVKDFMKGMRQNTWLNQADAEKIIAFTQSNILAQPYAKLRSVAKDLPGTPQERIQQFGKTTSARPFDASSVEAENTSEPPAPSLDELHRSQAIEGAAGVPGQQEVDEANADTREAHARAVRDRPDLYHGSPSDQLSEQLGIEDQDVPIRQFEVSAVELAHLAQKARNEGVPDEQNTSLNQLKDLAGNYINLGQTDDPEAYFAAMLLHDLGEYTSPVEEQAQSRFESQFPR